MQLPTRRPYVKINQVIVEIFEEAKDVITLEKWFFSI
jgi:hypothetical protein